jgi:thymidylate synthase
MNWLTADLAWHRAYDNAVAGDLVSPRGMETFEVLNVTHTIDMRYPVVTSKERKLNYRAMAAEALWILGGSNRLEDIEPWLPRMREFSDNGITLAGAYGPRIHQQMKYVVETLVNDPDSRQATLTTWMPNPASSKDIPCTVAMDFKIRRDKLHLSVFMRSSDVWLGLPYDIFSFACIAYTAVIILRDTFIALDPGMLWITAASSHVYAKDKTQLTTHPFVQSLPAPGALWASDVNYFLDYLHVLRDSRPGDPHRWWEK